MVGVAVPACLSPTRLAGRIGRLPQFGSLGGLALGVLLHPVPRPVLNALLRPVLGAVPGGHGDHDSPATGPVVDRVPEATAQIAPGRP